MKNILNAYTLKSSINSILHYHFRNRISTNIDHNEVIAYLWRGTFMLSHPGNDRTPEKLIEKLQEVYGDFPTEDLGVIDSYETRRLQLPNSTWYLGRDTYTHVISPCSPSKGSCFSEATETAAYVYSFDQFMPQIHVWIDEAIANILRDKMICEIIASTGRGIIDQVAAEENLDMPKITEIIGTKEKRVIIHFEGTDEKLSTPLNYLRIRLINRFKPSRRIRKV